MAIPLLKYALETQNARIPGYEVGGDEEARIFTTDQVLDDGDMDALIEASYRQIFFHAFKSDRDRFLESQLRNGQITVRDFIRGLLLSDTFRRAFYRFNSNYQVVTQVVQRVLGRDVHGQAERIAWSIVIANQGLDAFVDVLLDSSEYLDNFGYSTVPYQRRRVLPGRDLGETPFNIKSPRYEAYWRGILCRCAEESACPGRTRTRWQPEGLRDLGQRHVHPHCRWRLRQHCVQLPGKGALSQGLSLLGFKDRSFQGLAFGGSFRSPVGQGPSPWATTTTEQALDNRHKPHSSLAAQWISIISIREHRE
ncbi:MAG: hypothetical protein ERJ68_06500 [Aphanocapsa feldmannii 277cI]|uniref:PBS-linker domain-containing protein n=1 Tax=Aphanocapsa feldmannii 277cI TaxID=2507554 RepID=A0A524RSS2_9CHRO|nr:MAG: hypothetical protein ERJ68_06500 [Aphanocapsa feldmannii 277cI]